MLIYIFYENLYLYLPIHICLEDSKDFQFVIILTCFSSNVDIISEFFKLKKFSLADSRVKM